MLGGSLCGRRFVTAAPPIPFSGRMMTGQPPEYWDKSALAAALDQWTKRLIKGR
jgi:hypothetical protein